jgi:hypothetical protein
MPEPWEIWNAILDKAACGVSALTDVEKTIYWVNCYLCNLDMGSVTSALYNLSPAGTSEPVPWSNLRATAAAIQEVGDLESARILTEFAVRFECAPYGEALTWEDFLGASCPSELACEATQILEQHGPNLWELLEKFTANYDNLNIP